MPTYTIKYSNFNITKKDMEKIARGVTKAHNIATGANSFFAQVIFEKNLKGSHFMGGKTVNSKEIFLNGQIRSGRTNETKQNLLKELMKSLIQNSKVKKAVSLANAGFIPSIDALPRDRMDSTTSVTSQGKNVISYREPSILEQVVKRQVNIAPPLPFLPPKRLSPLPQPPSPDP